MSQEDYVLASGQSGTNLRTDIQAHLRALLSQNSGASEPATMYAYMLWLDTTNGLLKQRNGANTGWVIRATAAETRVVAKSSAYTVVDDDFGKTFKASGTWSLALTAAATLADGFWFEIRNTGSGTITIDPDGSEQVDGATTVALAAGESCTVVCDGAGFFTIGRPATSATTVTVPVRQTVLAGPVDSAGLAAFGGSTGGTTVTATGTLVATAANGFGSSGAVDVVGSVTNPSWTGLSTNGTMYLYVDIAGGVATPGSGTLAPNYQWGGTYSTTSGQFTFGIQEMVGKVGNGSSAVQTNRVYVGEVTVAGSVVTAITWYALMGRYSSAAQAIPSLGGTIDLSHNLGVKPKVSTVSLVNVTAQEGYSTGDEVSEADYYIEVASHGFATRLRALVVRLIYAAGANIYVLNATTGAAAVITPANWNVRFDASRGW